MVGGAVVAWVLSGAADWDFRSTWIGASLLLFIVPGTVAIVKIRGEAQAHAKRVAAIRGNDDGR